MDVEDSADLGHRIVHHLYRGSPVRREEILSFVETGEGPFFEDCAASLGPMPRRAALFEALGDAFDLYLVGLSDSGFYPICALRGRT